MGLITRRSEVQILPPPPLKGFIGIWRGLPAYRTTIDPNTRQSCGLARYSGALELRCQYESSAQVVC
jgi:hypothetical protein